MDYISVTEIAGVASSIHPIRTEKYKLVHV